LILDEFAFHEDSAAIWEAAEPILASNPDFRCRIASTGNGKHNMFYRMASGFSPTDSKTTTDGERNTQVSTDETPASCTALPNDYGKLYTSANGFTVSRVTRTAAYEMGVKIYELKGKRAEITPETARLQAMDKKAYDQNYECAFADENMTLLSYELISAAQSDVVSIDAQEWSGESLARMRLAKGDLEVGNDIGRNHDLSMVTVIEREGQLRRVVAMLKMENMRLPDQQKQLAVVCFMPKFRSYCGDMTGLGLGFVEFLQEQFGRYRIQGVNFSATEAVSHRMKVEGRKEETARVTEIMAVNLLTCFEEHSLKDLPNDPALADDLRKPEKVTSPGGRVSIAATRDEAGHADGFWSLALAVRAGEKRPSYGAQSIIFPYRVRLFPPGHKGLLM
jgi:phage FluMu gp28-like protein